MFRRMIGTIVAGLLPIAAIAGDSWCSDIAPRIIATAYPDAVQKSDQTYAAGDQVITVARADLPDPYAMVCRTWPAYPDRLLVAVPLMLTAGATEMREGDLDLLVLDVHSLAVEARLRLHRFIQEDAVGLRGIWFDTARYRLIGDRTAFGLRREMLGDSRPNPFKIVGLWLFDLDRGQIRPILDGLEVVRDQGEWDTDCAGVFDLTERVLDVTPTGGEGADIVVTTRATRSVQGYVGDECVGKDSIGDPGQVTLRFDGRRYPVPDDMLDLYFQN